MHEIKSPKFKNQAVEIKMGRLQDKVVIITGAATGMGQAVAKLFAKEGAVVAVTDINEELGTKTAEEIQMNGGQAQFWKLNVAVESDVEIIFKNIYETFGKIDILINNAGVLGIDKPTHEVEEQEWDNVFAVDVKGVFFGTKHVIPYMKKNKKGSIVNFSSIYGLVGSHELAPYHAAKGAVTIMTKKDAVTYGKDKIRVNSVHPGTILTPLVKEFASRGEGGFEAYEKVMVKKHPINSLGEPEDVAYGVLFLASDESKFVTGAHLVIDGGYTAQ
ncbi:glucose 1-dehydrogenase [Peribacillus sp. FSL E2-0159]|uniref:SDR family NAD(P)-dependent oxidoreductase n=1 Tax=Peribacillus sp. FSL E2-0159 TaxID=2975289 RepID=UPI00315A4F4F